MRSVQEIEGAILWLDVVQPVQLLRETDRRRGFAERRVPVGESN